MNRRELLKSAAVSLPLLSVAGAQEVAARRNGLPPLTIKDCKVITTSGGSHYRWIFLKIITSEPGLYGIGSANNNYETMAVVAALEDHLKPWLIGKDPDRIEDLWQSAQMSTYWRNGPVNNNMLSAMDMALWDIKGKRAGMPVYEMLGGKARDGVPVYDHQGGKTKEECLDALQKSLANGFTHVRIQLGGYGGGGFTPAGRRQSSGRRLPGSRLRRAGAGRCHPSSIRVPAGQGGLRAEAYSRCAFASERHERGRTGAAAAALPDVLCRRHSSPEQLAYYRNIREICTTPQAVGEVFSHPYEVIPLVTDRLIDFIRCRVAATGGITPIKKLTTLCEIFGVRTAFQEGGENDPINQLASYHVDISSSAFGIQEENHFPAIVHEMFPGMGEIRKGYLYGSGKPGLGVDINEELAARNPLGPIPDGGAYPTDRTIDGTVVKP